MWGLPAGTCTVITKKQRKQIVESSGEGGGGLYCLVVLFLLLYVICASVPTEGSLKSHREGFIQKLQSLFNNFSRTTFDFQGPPTRKVNLRFVQNCTFPVQANGT